MLFVSTRMPGERDVPLVKFILACKVRVRVVPLVEVAHLVLTRMPDESLGCMFGGVMHLVLTRFGSPFSSKRLRFVDTVL